MALSIYFRYTEMSLNHVSSIVGIDRSDLLPPSSSSFATSRSLRLLYEVSVFRIYNIIIINISVVDSETIYISFISLSDLILGGFETCETPPTARPPPVYDEKMGN